MTKTYDLAIIGLGAAGSAAAYHAAHKGLSVAGFDRFHPPHTLGSSHGATRIIRQAYFEHPLYVPLILRAYELWERLERESGQKLFLRTGGLYLGRREGGLVGGARLSALRYSLPLEVLSREKLRKRFPAFRLNPGEAAVFEERAGILFPEECIRAHLALAAANGAKLRFEERVLGWRADRAREGAIISTDKGNCRAARLLITAGAWLPSLLSRPALPLKVERQVLYWFEPQAAGEIFTAPHFPVFIREYGPDRYFYGFPDIGEGVKVALHHQGAEADPDNLDREVPVEEVENMRRTVAPLLPGLPGKLLASSVCMYTNTPDGHFILDRHPAFPQVILGSACSGHGFKFSSATGEALAALAAGETYPLDLSAFRLDRFN